MGIANLKRITKNLALSTLVSASALSITMMPGRNVLGMNSEKNNIAINISDSIISSLSSSINNTYNHTYNPSITNLSSISSLNDIFQYRDSLIKRENTVDSLVNKAKEILNISVLQDKEHADSIINNAIDYALMRPKINQEALVDKILDTLNTGSEIVDKYFIKASIKEESNYDPNISSYAHAQGLLQLIKDTWNIFGEGNYSKNVHNPIKNIRAGVKYYLWLENFMSEEYIGWSSASIGCKRGLLLAAYNGGHNRLKRKGFDIKKMPKESRSHITKVNNTIAKLQAEDLFKELALYRENKRLPAQNYLAYADFYK
jgi:membrane-bound lytic murein transglycosylase MltF